MLTKRLLFTALIALLITACLFSLVSCGDGYYDPIKSSSRDRRVIAEFGEDEVNYELFRFLFMSRISEFDGGDRSRWSAPDADRLWKRARDLVLEDIAEYYAVFDICRKWGLDPMGENIETVINENIKLDIDGGLLADGTIVTGYGSVKEYKQALKENYCTDAVRRLIYRYKACVEALDSYIVDNHAQGKITVTDEQLLTFAASEECAHVNRVFVSFESMLNNREAARETIERYHDRLLAAMGNYDLMVETVFSQTLSTVDSSPALGVWYGKLSADDRKYPVLYQTIFSIEPNEISEIIEEWNGYYIVYGMDRSIDLDNVRMKNMLLSLFLEEMYWGEIRTATKQKLDSIVYTKHFDNITPADLMEVD